GDVQFYTVHISTGKELKGQWVTGLPLIGEQNLSLVNYSMFSGEGPVKDLFWQDGDFALQNEVGVVSIYSRTPLKAVFYEKLEKVNFLSKDHFAIINGTNIDGIDGFRMLFVPNATVAKVQQNVLITQLEATYDFGDSPYWLKELMASFLTRTVFGGEKTREVAATITAQLTDAQLTDWQERLQALQGKNISGEMLDKELSEVLGASTKYISMNAQSEKSYPFLYNDPRNLYVNSEKQPAVQVVLKDGEVLYGADLLLESIGYDVSIGEHGYYVVSETHE